MGEIAYIVAGVSADGKRTQKKPRGFSTRKAAEEAMQLELHQRRAGSYEHYRQTVNKHLKPALGSVFVQDLTPAAVQKSMQIRSTPVSVLARCSSAICGSRRHLRSQFVKAR